MVWWWCQLCPGFFVWYELRVWCRSATPPMLHSADQRHCFLSNPPSSPPLLSTFSCYQQSIIPAPFVPPIEMLPYTKSTNEWPQGIRTLEAFDHIIDFSQLRQSISTIICTFCLCNPRECFVLSLFSASLSADGWCVIILWLLASSLFAGGQSCAPLFNGNLSKCHNYQINISCWVPVMGGISAFLQIPPVPSSALHCFHCLGKPKKISSNILLGMMEKHIHCQKTLLLRKHKIYIFLFTLGGH